MPDFRMLNGCQKCTVIETFDNRAVLLVGPEKIEFPSLEACKKHISESKMEVNIQFIFGSDIKREIQKPKGV